MNALPVDLYAWATSELVDLDTAGGGSSLTQFDFSPYYPTMAIHVYYHLVQYKLSESNYQRGGSSIITLCTVVIQSQILRYVQESVTMIDSGKQQKRHLKYKASDRSRALALINIDEPSSSDTILSLLKN